MKKPGAKRCSPQVPEDQRCIKMVFSRDVHGRKQLTRCTRRKVVGSHCNLHDESKILQRDGEQRQRRSDRASARSKYMQAQHWARQAMEQVAIAAVRHVRSEYALALELGVPYAENDLSKAADVYGNLAAEERRARGRYEAAAFALRKRGKIPAIKQPGGVDFEIPF